MSRLLPVTLVGGFFGAGKTSLLHHLISVHEGGHLAILVENPGALNLDAKAFGGLCGAMRRNSDVVIEIPSGDTGEQLAFIAARLREIQEAGRFERVLIETSGATNAARLAEHFGLLPDHPKTFAPWAALQQIVTVVDALEIYRSAVAPRKGSGQELLEFRLDQIAGASVLMLNKCDLVTDDERNACTKFLRAINSQAGIIETAYGEIPPEMALLPATSAALGMAVEARVPELKIPIPPDSTELASVVYRVYRPFHPERFWNWYEGDHPGLLRVKGIIWLATRNLLVGGVSRTRWQNSCGAAGVWWAALPREDWPEEVERLNKMQETWREPYGDRRQELVLVGDAKQLAVLPKQLDACLLTADEYAKPVKEWGQLPDPFPVWDLDEE